jgi:DNA-binding NtrC family response regulator
MKSLAKMSALAYVYDHMGDLPAWFRSLTPKQIESIAILMTRWQLPTDYHKIVPIEEIERREVLRAVAISGGNVIKAAHALQVGKTTLYRRLRIWGYTVQNRILRAKESATKDVNRVRREDAY